MTFVRNTEELLISYIMSRWQVARGKQAVNLSFLIVNEMIFSEDESMSDNHEGKEWGQLLDRRTKA